MPRRLVKDRAAETDLIGIWTYSFEQWGEAQADRYLDALERGIGKLADDPEYGRQRNELRTGYWSKRIEHHAVFYTVTPSEVRIRRVLHESMDVDRHL
ncbi:MAG: type II toxin-antitoxin system RelE/ParE family toxin [Acidobacteria bacterium]|nr:type II toxin-antitoxin system RelE/ParE family toxin [Acidobacteriota bacterium]